ncbi:MAG TPA: glycosyltransferase family 2 protein [Flavisolibacter sp.]|nr:glycosyltransferase family 2 protein [Flavisolibacter sp.]
MQPPLISVLIPTYNVERFVEEAIRSIMLQTYQNLEIIIVDDCSTDKTYSILEQLATEDARIKLYRNRQNLKIVASLNYALSQASGKLIARMDGDDISAPDRIEKQYSYLVNHPEVDLVGVSYYLINEDGEKLKEERFLTQIEKVNQATRYVSPVPHIWLARRSIYTVVGDYRIPTAEDYDFILRAIDKGFHVTNLAEPLYYTRLRNGNTLTSAGLVQKKSFQYVQKLRKERKENGGRDSFTSENLNQWLQSSWLEQKCFSVATVFNQKFILLKHRNKIGSLPWLALAILFSPKYLLREKYRRYKYKKMLAGI